MKRIVKAVKRSSCDLPLDDQISTLLKDVQQLKANQLHTEEDSIGQISDEDSDALLESIDRLKRSVIQDEEDYEREREQVSQLMEESHEEPLLLEKTFEVPESLMKEEKKPRRP